MSNETDYWFARVDIDVAKDKELSITAKFIFTILCIFADKDKRGCWPSNETVADTAGVSESTLLRAYKELEARGVISRESRFKNGQQTSSYTLIVGHNAECYGGVIDDGAGVSCMTDRTRTNEQDIKDSLTREAELPERERIPEAPAESFSPEDAPEIMRSTAEYLLLKTGRKTLTENEISALQELSANQYPSRVQKEIDRACERFRRKGNSLETLTFCYIAGALRNQPSLKRKSRKKSEPDGMSLTQAEIDATREEQTEEELDNELAELKAEMLEGECE